MTECLRPWKNQQLSCQGWERQFCRFERFLGEALQLYNAARLISVNCRPSFKHLSWLTRHWTWVLHHHWKWECVEAVSRRMPKLEHFVTGLGLWCDLWLGSLVLFKMIDYISICGVNPRGIFEDSSLWKLSQKIKNNRTVTCFNQLSLEKEFPFIQTVGKGPEYLARREVFEKRDLWGLWNMFFRTELKPCLLSNHLCVPSMGHRANGCCRGFRRKLWDERSTSLNYDYQTFLNCTGCW